MLLRGRSASSAVFFCPRINFLKRSGAGAGKFARCDKPVAFDSWWSICFIAGRGCGPFAVFSRFFDNVVRRKRNAGGGCPGEFVGLCLFSIGLTDERDFGGLAFLSTPVVHFCLQGLSLRMEAHDDVSGLVMIPVPTGIKQ